MKLPRVRSAIAVMTTIMTIAGARPLPAASKNAAAPLAPWDRAENVQLGGFNRHFIVHVPPTFDAKNKLPAVIMLHGAGGTGQEAMQQTGWDRKADQENFIAAFPDAVAERPKRPASFLFNPQTWNDGSGRHQSGKRNDPDIDFIAYVIDTLRSRYGADPSRIYVTGFSNGASMTFRTGVELSDQLAAIAPVAGHLFVYEHPVKRAVPALYIIGRDDPLELPAGGVLKIMGEEVTQPPILENLQRWRDIEDCPLNPSSDARDDGIERVAFSDCRDGVQMVEYFIDDMGHVWPGGLTHLPQRLVGKPSDKLNATDVIWDFFKAHPMP
ncbi:MAG TPA: PHB depolymerase family esterase [Candidatus Binataceae bacterium]|nr:PHB depolymerase family esterase [Candidatus Binataceae bacterium]